MGRALRRQSSAAKRSGTLATAPLLLLLLLLLLGWLPPCACWGMDDLGTDASMQVQQGLGGRAVEWQGAAGHAPVRRRPGARGPVGGRGRRRRARWWTRPGRCAVP